MTWRDDLVRVAINGVIYVGASFRGVPFFVEQSERSGGRRTVVHEFPGRDTPHVEDMGKRALKFRVDGYVLGPNYLAQKNALLDALENTAGPGQLKHPYYGTLRAIGDSNSTHESSSDGGIARISIDFIEAPAQAPTPVIQPDAGAVVGASADAARITTRAALVATYNSAGLPSFALASAQRALTSAAAAVSAELAPVVTSTQELSTLTSQLDILTAQASSLVRQPAALLDAFISACTGIEDAAESAPGDVMRALLDAYNFDVGDTVRATTATRAREAANQSALVGALRQVLVIEAARLAPLITYSTVEDATATRDQVAGQLAAAAAGAGDVAYPALVMLRAQVLRAVPGPVALASTVTVTRRVAIPSLLLAYQLYGSVDGESDIIARNNISHPGFLAGDFKVLSNG